MSDPPAACLLDHVAALDDPRCVPSSAAPIAGLRLRRSHAATHGKPALTSVSAWVSSMAASARRGISADDSRRRGAPSIRASRRSGLNGRSLETGAGCGPMGS